MGNKQRVKGSAQWVVGPDSVQWAVSSEQRALGSIQMGRPCRQGKAHMEGQVRLLSLV